MTENMNILLAATEVAPFAKTGGLADVAGSLPKDLAGLGHDVRIVLPAYKQIQGAEYLTDLPVEVDGHLETAVIKKTSLPVADGSAVPVYLISNYKFFYRDQLYGYSDDDARFNFFSRAVLAMLPKVNFQPHVIHCNDWQTAPIPLFLKIKYEDEPFYQGTATLFTIHNLQYQGRFGYESLKKVLALGDRYFTPETLEFYGQVNFMKAGLIYADLINTVSQKYALEIQTSELGEGLDGLLRKRGHDLYGILNGIDYRDFDPQTDPRLAANFNIGNWEGKRKNKAALQQRMNLPNSEAPLLGMVSRLVNQKGLDLLEEILEELLQDDVQIVLLGSGEDHYQKIFSDFAMRYRHKMSVHIGFDLELAQLIYGGSDMFLMPSRFEPCGLGQLIALRYGSVPIVRSTGGLEDTITDYSRHPDTGNGFSFKHYKPEELLGTIKKALELFRNNQVLWYQQLVTRGMSQDFSWKQSAARYVELYQGALNRHQKTRSWVS